MLSFLYSLDSSSLELHSVPVVRDFADVFEEIRELPPKRETDFRIHLIENAKPVVLLVRHMAPRKRKESSKQIRELLEKGFIRRSISEWRAPAVFAAKADGSLRLCMDYRKLNKLTKKNRYSLPRIDDLFYQLVGSSVFSQLDLAMEFHQLRVANDCIDKISLRIPDAFFEWLVMPFGLANAPAYLISGVFRDVLNK